MSDYCSTTEIAQKWGLSGRRVGLLCAQERIPGATKIGKTWMIPADAAKPADPRREKKAPENPLAANLAHVVTATYISAPRENPDAIFDIINDERVRVVPETALAYVRGDFERARSLFHSIANDDAVKLCACSATIAASISMGDYPFYLEIEGFLKGVVQANGGSVSAFAELALTSAYLGALAPNMIPDWLKDGDFAALPPAAKPDALHKRAYYFYCIGQYESMLAVAQTALAVYDSDREVSVPCLYLRLMCALALHELGRKDEAMRWLLGAMRVYLPVGSITPFVELVLNFYGLMEQCLEKEFPAYYDAVIEQWKRTVPNWKMFHNQFTKGNLTLILSRRDFHMATLAARGVPYAKIAEQFNISAGRLNNIMREIYEKLCISGKKELAEFILLSSQKT